MKKLVLIRHGESVWNNEGLFAGWTDVDLSEAGINEAKRAGRCLFNAGFEFDIAFTSYLKRAIRTLWMVLDEMDLMWIPVEKDWRLNERHYGDLQGKNKDRMREILGVEAVEELRRGYSAVPPLLEPGDKRDPAREAKYAGIINQLPMGESLENTRKRFEDYWKENIIPKIKNKKRVLIVAHGNTLRSLMMILENIPEQDIPKVEIPTGNPLIYRLNDDLTPISKCYCLPTKKPAADHK